MPSGPGVISEDLIAEIALSVPPTIATFLLTSKQDVPAIVAQHKKSKTNTIQLCDRLVSGTYEELKNSLPGISIVQVIHVIGEESAKEASTMSAFVDALLLDSGNRTSTVKVLGGTGRTHDWRISRKIKTFVTVPVFLAGGLKPENVREAIRQVEPFGVDVCSGVRTDGRLDEKKLKKFMMQVAERESSER